MASLTQYCKDLLYRTRYGLTQAECEKGVLDACAFFGIPAPRAIEDLTNQPGGRTMFKNYNPESYEDDILCYNLREMKNLGMTGPVGFTAIFTHECAHRVLQNTTLPGVSLGQWEQELAADFFMGVRAGLEAQDITSIVAALSRTQGCGSHPTGKIREQYAKYGLFEGRRHLIQHRNGSVPEYISLFLEYRSNHYDELHDAELTAY